MGLRNLGLILSAIALPTLLVAELFPSRASSTVSATTPTPSAARSSAASVADHTDPAMATAHEPAMESDEASDENTSAVSESTAPAEPAAAVAPSTEAAQEVSADERLAATSVSRGNAWSSRRAAEETQIQKRSAATLRERKIRATAASPTAADQNKPNPPEVSSTADGEDAR